MGAGGDGRRREWCVNLEIPLVEHEDEGSQNQMPLDLINLGVRLSSKKEVRMGAQESRKFWHKIFEGCLQRLYWI